MAPKPESPTSSSVPAPPASPGLAAKAGNLTCHASTVTREDRERLNGHRGATLWFTGLSGSGKSTLANEVVARLHACGVHTALLDGDNVRHGLNRDLGFSPADRTENIRRVGEVARLMADHGLITLVAFISPYRKDRALARSIHETAGRGRFLEVHVKADVSVCEARDPKGLYKKARAGEISEFTGVSAPYEPPEHPEIEVDTARLTIDQAAALVLKALERQGIILAASSTP